MSAIIDEIEIGMNNHEDLTKYYKHFWQLFGGDSPFFDDERFTTIALMLLQEKIDYQLKFRLVKSIPRDKKDKMIPLLFDMLDVIRDEKGVMDQVLRKIKDMRRHDKIQDYIDVLLDIMLDEEEKTYYCGKFPEIAYQILEWNSPLSCELSVLKKKMDIDKKRSALKIFKLISFFETQEAAEFLVEVFEHYNEQQTVYATEVLELMKSNKSDFMLNEIIKIKGKNSENFWISSICTDYLNSHPSELARMNITDQDLENLKEKKQYDSFLL